MMKVGIPRALLYFQYYEFINSFFKGLDVDLVISKETNSEILNLGIKYAVDEACLPIKIYHGHVAYLRDKCDVLFIPRVMQLYEREFICPKFCGLPEMIEADIPNLPKVISTPLYGLDYKKLWKFSYGVGRNITSNIIKIKSSYKDALEEFSNKGYKNNVHTNMKVALIGHPYNIYDTYLNMNIVDKLSKFGVSVVTEENINDDLINKETKELFKRPFWTFARKNYGFASYVAKEGGIDGIIYLSSFACGIDSIVIELIKDKIGNLPFLVLKLDEQTGEAGLDTRIEAFCDMLERRCAV